jgi:AhpD family alkylhydroperoxidase
MTEFKIHTIESAPAEARGALEAARQKFGFLPNLLGELAAAPSALKGYLALGELLSESSLGPVEQQIVLIAASLENGCNYCVAAHSAGLKASGGADDQIDAVRSGLPLADPKLEAL